MASRKPFGFEVALVLLQHGMKVKRASWRGVNRGCHLVIVNGQLREDDLNLPGEDNVASLDGDDIMADDWQVFEGK